MGKCKFLTYAASRGEEQRDSQPQCATNLLTFWHVVEDTTLWCPLPLKTFSVLYFIYIYLCCQTPVQSPDFSLGTTSWLCFTPVTRTTTTTTRTTPKYTRRKHPRGLKFGKKPHQTKPNSCNPPPYINPTTPHPPKNNFWPKVFSDLKVFRSEKIFGLEIIFCSGIAG